MSCLQLLDLAPTWLGSMVQGLPTDPDDVEDADEQFWMYAAVFRTCSLLHNVMLTQPAVRPCLQISPAGRFRQLGQPPFARALARAEAAETKLHLCLKSTSAHQEALRQLLTSAAGLIHQGQQLQEPPAASQLKCITAVSIHDATLDNLLPDVLVQHCPNLQELSLQHVSFTDQYSAPQLTCSSLQKLSLTSVQGLASAGFKQHLLNLPSLTCLELGQAGSRRDYEEGGVFWAAISRYSSQLRGLDCRLPRNLPWSVTTQLPQLEELKLDLRLEGDAAMHQLLQSAPNLKRIKLTSITGLTSNLAQLQCSWQHLSLDNVYVAELAKLPLSSCKRLECVYSLAFRGKRMAEPSPEQMTAAVAAAQAAGGLHYCDGGIAVGVYPNDAELIAAAGPMLQPIFEKVWLEMESTDVDAEWSDWQALLAVLGQHLKCNSLVLSWDSWKDGAGAAAQVPELLPHVKMFAFRHTPSIYELKHMVRNATRPFTLHLNCCNSIRRRPDLEEVMQEAGHQLVTFYQLP